MPLVLSPNDRFFLVLTSDQALPPAEQPRFWFKHPSGHRQRELAEKLDELENVKSDSQASTFIWIDKVFEVLGEFLDGWDRLPGNVPFSRENIAEVLQYREALELIYGAWSYGLPRAADLKNSVSQSPPASDESASPVIAETAKAP